MLIISRRRNTVTRAGNFQWTNIAVIFSGQAHEPRAIDPSSNAALGSTGQKSEPPCLTLTVLFVPDLSCHS